jgi:hypothetical protein
MLVAKVIPFCVITNVMNVDTQVLSPCETWLPNASGVRHRRRFRLSEPMTKIAESSTKVCCGEKETKEQSGSVPDNLDTQTRPW